MLGYVKAVYSQKITAVYSVKAVYSQKIKAVYSQKIGPSFLYT